MLALRQQQVPQVRQSFLARLRYWMLPLVLPVMLEPQWLGWLVNCFRGWVWESKRSNLK